MMSVRVTFDYYPDDPDDSDSTGMSEDEFVELNDKLAQLGADNVTVERQDEPEQLHRGGGPKKAS